MLLLLQEDELTTQRNILQFLFLVDCQMEIEFVLTVSMSPV
jgi:hypothetical protein